jgi:creatinine amidohydrolase
MKTIRLEEMTWPEVEEALADGVDTVVVVAGATEQHGYHLPMGSDTMWGWEFGERVARRLGDALLAPVIPVGCSDSLMGFPGTMTIGESTLIDTIAEYCTSLAHHGFRRFVLISSHGGDFAPVQAAAERLRAERPELTFATALCDIQEIVAVIYETASRYEVAAEVAGAHSGEFETSVMLAVRPDLVHMDRAEAGWVGDIRQAAPDFIQQDMHAITEVGVLGDPGPARAAMGNAYLDDLVESVVESVESAFGASK